MSLRRGAKDTRYAEGEIASVRVTNIADMAQRLSVVEGAPFADTGPTGYLRVWVISSYAQELITSVGHEYILMHPFLFGADPLLCRIEGIVEPKDAADPSWYAPPSSLMRGRLLTTREQYLQHIAPLFAEGTSYNSWYFALDDRRAGLHRAKSYAAGLEAIGLLAESRLPRGRMDYAPTQELALGHARQSTMALLLLVFSVPVLGMLAFFMIVTSMHIAR
jgi:putative ABC transport system permease protein